MFRQLAYSALTNGSDPLATALLAVVPAERIRSATAADADSPEMDVERPFIVIREQPDERPFRDVETRAGGVTIWAHDNPGSLVKIDHILGLVSAILNSVAATTVSGHWLTSVEDQGWSEDLYDDHFETAVRYGTYRMVARPPEAVG